jgi:hypothetical protein
MGASLCFSSSNGGVSCYQVFIVRGTPLGEKDLDALMTSYSEQYRDQDRTKAGMRKIWKALFDQYDRIATLHAFFRSLVTPGNSPTADITCTGALWATLDGTDQRVNLSFWAVDLHQLSYEHGVRSIIGQRRNASNPPEFGQAPPPLL